MTGQMRIVIAVAAVLLAGGLVAAIAELTGGSGRTRGLAKASIRGTSAQNAPGRSTVDAAANTATPRASGAAAARTLTNTTTIATRTSSTAPAGSVTRATSATHSSAAARATRATSSGATSQAPPTPSASPHVVSANAEGELHLVHASGSTLYEEGRAHGALSGDVHAQLHVGATFSGSFVFFTSGGEIEGRGSAQPHSAAGPIESFAGSDRITGGSGRYAHAHGSGRLSGTFNRRTYAVVLRTSGAMYE
jgi:hypothetical protein